MSRILTVDDSTSLRLMVGFTLREAGYEVTEAADGVDALKKLEDTPVSMVISDLLMPHMDGIELTRRIRLHPNHRFIPVLLLTTESHQGKKDEARRAGATGWIVKPFRPEKLVAVVKRILG